MEIQSNLIVWPEQIRNKSTSMKPKHVPHGDPRLKMYEDILQLFPEAEIVEFDDDIPRFKEKPFMRWVADNIDLNKLADATRSGVISLQNRMEFYIDIGYSLCGFSELFDDSIKELFEKHGEEFSFYPDDF